MCQAKYTGPQKQEISCRSSVTIYSCLFIYHKTCSISLNYGASSLIEYTSFYHCESDSSVFKVYRLSQLIELNSICLTSCWSRSNLFLLDSNNNQNGTYISVTNSHLSDATTHQFVYFLQGIKNLAFHNYSNCFHNEKESHELFTLFGGSNNINYSNFISGTGGLTFAINGGTHAISHLNVVHNTGFAGFYITHQHLVVSDSYFIGNSYTSLVKATSLTLTLVQCSISAEDAGKATLQTCIPDGTSVGIEPFEHLCNYTYTPVVFTPRGDGPDTFKYFHILYVWN